MPDWSFDINGNEISQFSRTHDQRLASPLSLSHDTKGDDVPTS